MCLECGHFPHRVSDEGSRNKKLLHTLHFADENLTFMTTLAF